jgi:hypothetical protein
MVKRNKLGKSGNTQVAGVLRKVVWGRVQQECHVTVYPHIKYHRKAFNCCTVTFYPALSL